MRTTTATLRGGPGDGHQVTVDLYAEGLPRDLILVAMIDERAVALRFDPEVLHRARDWTSYRLQPAKPDDAVFTYSPIEA